tara:strand:+ start:2481 stop:3251 length:771 start_codon:yes stop_codon:yes gene_type:complete
MILGIPNNSAIVTGSGDTAGGLAANVLLQEPHKVVTFPTGAGYIILDFDSSTAFKLIALGYITGADTSSTWRYRFATSEGNLTASPTLDSGVINLWNSVDLSGSNRTHTFKEIDLSARWVRIDFTNSSNSLSIGRVCVCPTFTHARGLTDPSINIKQLTRENATSGGLFRSIIRQHREISASFPVLEQSEVNALSKIERDTGASSDLFLCVDESATNYVMDLTFFCLLEEGGFDFLRVPGWDKFNRAVTFTEVIMP